MWIKKSLFAKLLLGMLIAAVIPFSLSNIVSYTTTSQGIEEEVIQLNHKTMSLGMENVKRYLQELTLDSVAYYKDNTLMNNLRMKEASAPLSIQIRNELNTQFGSRPEIRAVRYMNAMINQTFTLYDNVDLGTDLQFSHVEVPPTPLQWDSSKEFEVIQIGNEQVLTMHRLLIDYPDSTILGLTSLYIGLDKIEAMINPLAVSERGEVTFLYLHNEMNLLYTTGKNHAALHIDLSSLTNGQGYIPGKFNGQDGILIYLKDDFKELPLMMMKFVPSGLINESANKMLNRVLIIQLIAIAFVILLVSVFSFVTISPIKRLLRMIGKVESGNFSIEPEPTYGNIDELGVLEQRFQTMVRNLDELVIKEYRSQVEISTARLKMLQAQINPHFLYNTLQSIGTLALRNGVEEISDKITELGAILRYSMDIETENVPLHNEIRHVEDYLSLQKGRFKHKLSYTLSYPEEVLNRHVPKMILQPLVENSIVHGFEKGSGTGTLHISIELKEGKLFIRVIDNGKGMSQETIQQLIKEFEIPQRVKKDGGIGLMNVLHRLQLYYGEGFEWDITSVSYQSTVISLGIPDKQTRG